MWDLIVSVPDHCLSFYFMSAMLTCKFEKPIKTEGTMPGTRSNMGFLALMSK